MSIKENSVIGAMVHQDGKLQPVEGPDPSSQGTYREEPAPSGSTDTSGVQKTHQDIPKVSPGL